MTAPPMPEWASKDGPWCRKNWLPLNVPDSRYDTCLLPPDHEGHCRGVHGRWLKHGTHLFLGRSSGG